jgi:hypothetical protein
LCFGIGNFVVAFIFAVCCSVHSNSKLLCNKHLNFSKHSNNKLLCNRQSEFQSIQTANFCATDSMNFSLFKHKTFVEQRLNFSPFKQQTFVQQTSDFSRGFLRFSKSPKTCRVLVLQKNLICMIFIVLNISSTFGLWVIWRL